MGNAVECVRGPSVRVRTGQVQVRQQAVAPVSMQVQAALFVRGKAVSWVGGVCGPGRTTGSRVPCPPRQDASPERDETWL